MFQEPIAINETIIDNPSIFLRTPAYKGGLSNFLEMGLAGSENKMNVSPFFNKK